MKPAWDQLGDEYADSTSVLIGDADCTGSAKDLCEAHEVRGYPTIKYFNSDNPKGADYSGGRDYDALKQFTEENLKASCLLDDDSGCSDKALPHDSSICPPLPPGAPTTAHAVLRRRRISWPSGRARARTTSRSSSSASRACLGALRPALHSPAAASPRELSTRLPARSGSMKPDLKKWLNQRKAILKQL